MATGHQKHRTFWSRSSSSTVYFPDAMAQMRMPNTPFPTTLAKGGGGRSICSSQVALLPARPTFSLMYTKGGEVHQDTTVKHR